MALFEWALGGGPPPPCQIKLGLCTKIGLLHTLNLLSCLRALAWAGLLVDSLLVREADNTEGIGVGV